MGNYYVTGSGGFIGKHLCNHLEERGDTVIRHNRNYFAFTGLEKCDTVINLHAYGNHSGQKNIDIILDENLGFLQRLINASIKTGVKNFYNVSSSSVNLSVQTPYSLSKKLGEELMNHYKHKFELALNVRPYSVFGEGEASNRFIPTVIRCLKTGESMPLDKRPTHDWIYVNSFVDLMLNGETECGSGMSFCNYDIVKMLEGISGKQLNYTEVEGLRNYDTKDWVCPKKNKLKLDLFEGLKKTYECFNG